MSSDYEKQRLANIAANHARLVALGIEQDVATIRSDTRRRPAVKGSAINKKAKVDAVPPRSRSLRLQNLDADGQAMPDKPAVPAYEAAPRRVRKSSAPLDAAKVSTGATSPEEAAAFLARLGKKDTSRPGKPANALAATAIDLSKLTVDEDDIAKLVPERIFSLEVSPSPSKLIVAAGDTWGRVGLWDVGAGDDTPVATFEPHSRPVAGMRILPHMPHQLLSCSHDGSVRCLDLGGAGASSFVEVYRAPEDGDGEHPMLHGLSRTAGEGGAIAICRSDGAVVLLDPRAPSAGAAVRQLHEKKIFSADFSPEAPQVLATASLDRTVALWDVRALGGGKKAKALATIEHGLSVTAVRFSASGGRLLTTCNDNLLRVFDGGGAKGGGTAWALQTAVKHNNKTGRYITCFQAEWQRGSDDGFLCGSLEHPRGIDVYSADGGGALRERLEPDAVGSVVSLIAQHPSRPELVASNSGGKCFVWR